MDLAIAIQQEHRGLYGGDATADDRHAFRPVARSQFEARREDVAHPRPGVADSVGPVRVSQVVSGAQGEDDLLRRETPAAFQPNRRFVAVQRDADRVVSNVEVRKAVSLDDIVAMSLEERQRRYPVGARDMYQMAWRKQYYSRTRGRLPSPYRGKSEA